jgi:hypothetical protein
MAAEVVGYVVEGRTHFFVDGPEVHNPEQEIRLREQLKKAHAASRLAQDTIEEIAAELRFPLAFSTRIHDDEEEEDDAGSS